jgi:hypothetical protein
LAPPKKSGHTKSVSAAGYSSLNENLLSWGGSHLGDGACTLRQAQDVGAITGFIKDGLTLQIISIYPLKEAIRLQAGL